VLGDWQWRSAESARGCLDGVSLLQPYENTNAMDTFPYVTYNIKISCR
jgi:hypothetical protein